jgi:hypothetical protein
VLTMRVAQKATEVDEMEKRVAAACSVCRAAAGDGDERRDVTTENP